MSYTRRSELTSTKAEADASNAILMADEALYVKLASGRRAVRFGDGVTPVKNIPDSINYDEIAAKAAAAEQSKKDAAKEVDKAKAEVTRAAEEADRAQSIADSVGYYTKQESDTLLATKADQPYDQGSGESIAVADSAGGLVRNLQIVGDTVQKAYVATAPESTQILATGKNLFQVTVEDQTVNGVVITNNGNGTISVRGKATDGVYVSLGRASLPAGTYRLSGCPAGGSSTKYTLFSGGVATIYDYGAGVGFTTAAAGELRVSLAVYAGNTVDLLLKPMASAGTSQIAFEPYSGNGVSPSPDYPQTFLPTVKAGVYQVKTHCGVFQVTVPDLYGVGEAVDQVVVDPVVGKAWVKAATAIYTFTGEERFLSETLGERRLIVFTGSSALLKSKGLCTHYTQGSPNDTNDCFYTTTIQVEFVAFNVSNSEYPSDGAFKTFLAGQYQAKTPVKVLYQRTTPAVTEIPCTKISGPDMNILNLSDMANYLERTEDTITYNIHTAQALNRSWILANLKPSTRYTMHYKAVILDRPEGYDVTAADYIGFVIYDASGSLQNNFHIPNSSKIPIGKEVEFNGAFTTPATLHNSGTNYRMLAYPELWRNSSGDGKAGTVRFSEIEIQAVSGAPVLDAKRSDYIPSQELPISLENITDRLEVVSCGVNLFNVSKYMGYNVGTTIDSDTFTTEFTTGGLFINNSKLVTFPANGTYRFSFHPVSPKCSAGLFVYNARGDLMRNAIFKDANTQQSVVFTANEPVSLCVSGNGQDKKTCTYQLSLTYGAEEVPYQPYTGNTYTIPLPQPLRKDDMICEIDGRFKLVQKRATIEYHGTKSIPWDYSTEYKRISSYTHAPPGRARGYDLQMLCSAFKFMEAGTFYPPYGSFSSNPEIGNLFFGIDTSKIASVDDWKTFLTAQSNVGTPLTVEYMLAAPVYIDLPDSTQAILRNISTQPGATHIYTTNAVKPRLSLSYRLDLSEFVKRIHIAEGQAQTAAYLSLVSDEQSSTEQEIARIAQEQHATESELNNIETQQAITDIMIGVN